MQLRTTTLIFLCLAIILTVFVLLDPIAQNLAYHRFADQRFKFGIPNFQDTVSSLAFLITGWIGLPRGRAPWWTAAFWFFFSVMLTGLGSTYYHLAPNNDRLLWDRLPITLSVMSLLSAFIADRVNTRAGIRLYLPALALAGVSSAVYWWLTEASGQGDLRAYGLAQFLPILAMAYLCFGYSPGTWLSGRKLSVMIILYALAKLSENDDMLVYLASNELISGHSLKHYLAALATAVPAVHLLQLRQAPARYLVRG